MPSPACVRNLFAHSALAHAIRKAPIIPLSALVAAGVPLSLHADEISAREYDIPAGALEIALNRFGREAGILLSYSSELTAGRSSPGLRGRYTVPQGLTQLLAGSGLQHAQTGAGTYTLQRLPDGAVTLQKMKIEADAYPRYEVPPSHAFKADYQDSATKTPLSIRKTPQSISVVTEKSIEMRQARDLPSALELSAGAVAGTFASGGPFTGLSRLDREEISLRGQRLDGSRDIRIDGFSVGSEFVTTDVALFERVDVVKGPSSSLYGPGSLAGFINRVSKKPQLENQASVVAQAGSYDTYRVEGDATGALDEEKLFAGRMIVTYEDSGSFIDGVDREQYLIAPSLSALLGEKTRLLFQTYVQNTEGTPSAGIPLQVRDNGELVAPHVSRSLYAGKVGNSALDTDQYQVSLRADHELNDRWLTTLMLQKARINYVSKLDNYAYGLYEEGDTYLYASRFTRDSDSWAGELRVDGRFDLFDREHQMLAGIEKRTINNDVRNAFSYIGVGNIYAGDFEPDSAPAIPSIPVTERDTLTEGVYSQFVFNMTGRTRLLAGLRYGNAEQRNSGQASKEKSATTYRLGVSQDLNTNLTAFASYATSFVPVVETSPTNSVLDPETGKGFELGLKGTWLDDRLVATASVYRQDREDVPVALTRDECLAGGVGLTGCSASSGEQRFDGAELEVIGNPLDGLTLGLAAAWVDGEFIARDDPSYGLDTPNTVERQTNLFADYVVNSGAMKGFGVGATLVSLGTRHSGVVGQFADGYDRVDLNFSYAGIEQWDFGLQVRNLFDEKYVERVFNAGQGSYFVAPRTALLRVEYRFDR